MRILVLMRNASWQYTSLSPVAWSRLARGAGLICPYTDQLRPAAEAFTVCSSTRMAMGWMIGGMLPKVRHHWAGAMTSAALRTYSFVNTPYCACHRASSHMAAAILLCTAVSSILIASIAAIGPSCSAITSRRQNFSTVWRWWRRHRRFQLGQNAHFSQKPTFRNNHQHFLSYGSLTLELSKKH